MTRWPPISFASSIFACASPSCSGISALSGRWVGTVSIEWTWIPRRRFEASLTAVATISGENASSSSKPTRTLRYSTSSTPSGSGITTLTVSVSGSFWLRR